MTGRRVAASMIPIVDVFAGPGGLGEGFAAYVNESGERTFDLRLSVEKNPYAHRTLKLRAFFRLFGQEDVPEDYYEVLRGKITETELYEKFPVNSKEASRRAWCVELGSNAAPQRDVRSRLRRSVSDGGNWVLLGGPPCQAYSVVGRSRNKGIQSYRPEADVRHHLYLEYLQIVADHRPAVFVMENVKGLLSATLWNQRILLRMLGDLECPPRAFRREKRGVARGVSNLRYRIYSLVHSGISGDADLGDFVINAEEYGIPQARHRIILLGIRDDITGVVPQKLIPREQVKAGRVLRGLPRVRAGISDRGDSAQEWRQNLLDALNRRWFAGVRRAAGAEVQDRIRGVLGDLVPPRRGRGGEFITYNTNCDYEREWFVDPRVRGVCNFSTRTHMPSDFHRYLFAACFAKVKKVSPRLRDFPPDLLPDHANVGKALTHTFFCDRFRVQLEHEPSTTVTSHMSKDGHYYIHPDPKQCRSLTVREAARRVVFSVPQPRVGPPNATPSVSSLPR